MESLDRHIVTLLAREGRMSFADLGRKVGLSTSAVHQRVKRLEDRGIIAGYRAEINHTAVGLPLTALISVVPFDPSAPDDIPERLTGVPQIVSCWSVAGDENYVLLIRVQRPQELEELLATIRAKGQCSTHTTVVLSTPWEGRAAMVPVDPPTVTPGS
ncbi:Lrp/AsnC family transcriptional regulator [Ornithinimicrobium sp. INDO-MA30-4]|uniref:Lrp/AsnC family transcriptional regulator n=1 Tax=Ornithinimicrobium sp. INDO-MA30-4 TaxID=2908651 RepID=UPI001F399510|nr:Lrp/AsnC family transcriptional regulator [Ornithinimicrobium sp. INDO-MA30-4]UJH71082.1 Lrp/AsnC family transcriptional regulator [Ornithinimicrobium sp. INDO-MA30-4]